MIPQQTAGIALLGRLILSSHIVTRFSKGADRSLAGIFLRVVLSRQHNALSANTISISASTYPAEDCGNGPSENDEISFQAPRPNIHCI
jgi:hypothetical protein